MGEESEAGREREIRCAPPQGELTQSVWEADRHPCLSSIPSIPFNPLFSHPSHLIIVRVYFSLLLLFLFVFSVLYFSFHSTPLTAKTTPAFLILNIWWESCVCIRMCCPCLPLASWGHRILFFFLLHYYNLLRMLPCSLVPGICLLHDVVAARKEAQFPQDGKVFFSPFLPTSIRWKWNQLTTVSQSSQIRKGG